jgi:hypothetical protein
VCKRKGFGIVCASEINCNRMVSKEEAYFTWKCKLTCSIYSVIEEESASLWEMIVCVILSKKVHINMCPIFDSNRVMTV